jgi:hypothetical protein
VEELMMFTPSQVLTFIASNDKISTILCENIPFVEVLHRHGVDCFRFGIARTI